MIPLSEDAFYERIRKCKTNKEKKKLAKEIMDLIDYQRRIKYNEGCGDGARRIQDAIKCALDIPNELS